MSVKISDLHNLPPSPEDAAHFARFDSDLLSAARMAGFAQDRVTYKTHYDRFFSTLDELDANLGSRRYLVGGTTVSAADQALAALLWLFEAAFYSLYKLNRNRLDEFANLAHYLRDIAADGKIIESLDLMRRRRALFLENKLINPKQRVPLGLPDLHLPHDRELRFGREDFGSGVQEDPQSRKIQGEWKRKISGHREHISSDGTTRYAAERDRYHLYIANNCPWCHRTAITRKLKRLDDVVSMDVLYYRRDAELGWQFKPEVPGCTEDRLFGSTSIRDIYARVGSSETSVPVLWDKKTNTIVSNESAEIIRMFDQGFGELASGSLDLYPFDLRTQIDRVNAFTYQTINNGAYKAGFADSQAAYELAYRKFFDALTVIECMLTGRRYLLGATMTEADVRLFPTIFRFDPVYFIRFNLDERRVRDLPALQRWLDRMSQDPDIAAASNLDHCREGYFGRTGNGIVPPLDAHLDCP